MGSLSLVSTSNFTLAFLLGILPVVPHLIVAILDDKNVKNKPEDNETNENKHNDKPTKKQSFQ